MKKLAHVAKDLADSMTTLDMLKNAQIAEVINCPEVGFGALYGFIYADLYAFFGENGKFDDLLDQGLEYYQNKETKTDNDILALITRAFLDGYKAGFYCREKLSDEINLYETETK